MISVAIDGPSAAGKSTIAKLAAKKLGFIYVDTGAMYRAIGYFIGAKNIALKDEKIIETLKEININLNYINDEQHIYLNNKDVSDKIRSNEVSKLASFVSSIKQVREFLLDKQRNLAINHNIIMDGRDIGTVVLPKAQVKIFLTASLNSRAKRRFRELKEKNIDITFDQIYNDIKKRDENDINRKIAPLQQAKNAILLDTSDLSLDQAVKQVVNIIKTKESELK